MILRTAAASIAEQLNEGSEDAFNGSATLLYIMSRNELVAHTAVVMPITMLLTAPWITNSSANCYSPVIKRRAKSYGVFIDF